MPRWRLLLVVVGCAAIGGVAAVAAPGAQPSSQPSWSKAVRIDRTASISAVACWTPRKCVAVDAGGHEVTFDPATLHANAPRKLRIASPLGGEYSLACSPAGLCALVSRGGYEETFATGSGRVLASARIAKPQACGVPTCGTYVVAPSVGAVACPSAHLCVAPANQGSVVTFDPGHPRAALRQLLPGYSYADALIALACPSAHQCTALGDADGVITFDPGNPRGTTVTAGLRQGSDLDMLACATTSQCTAFASRATEPQTGLLTGVAVTFDPRSTATPVTTTIRTKLPLNRIACPTSSMCVAVDEIGRALAADPRTDTAWTVTPIARMSTITDITCPTASRCVAVDVRGHAAVATLPPHQARTTPGSPF